MKKYQSLKDVYSSIYKPQKTLNEAMINIEFDDKSISPDPVTLSLKDIYAKRILGNARVLSVELKADIEKWIQAGGWNSPESLNQASTILSIIQEVYDTTDENVVIKLQTAIRALIENKSKLQSYTYSILEKSSKFYNFFYNTIRQIPEAKIFAEQQFMDSLTYIKFDEGGVGVGPGELFTTFFSECENPETGDLILPNGIEIELKGSTKPSKEKATPGGGRPGKQAADRAGKAMKNINKELKDPSSTIYNSYKNTMRNKYHNFDNLIKNYINKRLEEYNRLEKLNASNPEVSGVYFPPNSTTRKALKKKYEKLESFIDDLGKNKIDSREYKSKYKIDPQGFKAIIEKDINPNNALEDKVKKDIINQLKSLRVDINEYDNLTDSKISTKGVAGFSKNFNAYFDLSRGNLESREAVLNNIASFGDENKRKDIISVLEKIWDSTEYGGREARKIVGMIQTVDYAYEERFNYIVFFQAVTFNQLIIGPFKGEDYKSDLSLAFENIDRFEAPANTGGSGESGTGGGARGGFQIIPTEIIY